MAYLHEFLYSLVHKFHKLFWNYGLVFNYVSIRPDFKWYMIYYFYLRNVFTLNCTVTSVVTIVLFKPTFGTNSEARYC
jgi:hypothetical protein